MNDSLAPKRLLSLDALRGLAVIGMILVNNPIDFSAIVPVLRHVAWDGLSPADFVAPLFMFVMGVSMYFSLNRFDFKPSFPLVGKILLRTLLLFGVGLLISYVGSALYCGWSEAWEYLRIPGVLQRLAWVYGATGLCALVLPRRCYVPFSLLILVGYAWLMHHYHSEVSCPENIHGVIDRAVFGLNHLHCRGGWSHGADPEGLLGVVSGVAHTLLGMWTGRMLLQSDSTVQERLNKIYGMGTLLLVGGFVFSLNFPINKVLWSSTFVATSCGLSMLLLALLMNHIDVKGHHLCSVPLRAFGVNPLFLYVLADALCIYLGWQGYRGLLKFAQK